MEIELTPQLYKEEQVAVVLLLLHQNFKQTTNNLPEILKFDKTKEFFNLTDVRNFNDAIRNDTDEKLTDSEISSDLENLPLNQGI